MKKLLLLVSLVLAVAAASCSYAAPARASCVDSCTYQQDTDAYLWFSGSGWPNFWGSSANYWYEAVITSYNAANWNHDPTLFATFNNCGRDQGFLYPGQILVLYNHCGYATLGILYDSGTSGHLAHFHITLYR